MKILIAADHAGLELKNKLADTLRKEGHQVEDLGPFTEASVDYPDYADQVSRKLQTEENQAHLQEMGILVCGSGQGMALRANKFFNIRAALVYNDEIAKMAREHNNANIICIGSRFTDYEASLGWVHIFLKTPFAGGRHQTRVAKINASVS
ncbi:MAG: ribose 5-phosphate isomerase B [Bdellovibrionaceae bacterium]|nr:ribose 5-phosphate isomerase B [Bdellovibrio sp.]